MGIRNWRSLCFNAFTRICSLTAFWCEAMLHVPIGHTWRSVTAKAYGPLPGPNLFQPVRLFGPTWPWQA